MKYVYGPVPSRRLGKSLGIDTIPLKTCNWNCVYCQLGRTKPLTNKRMDYFPSYDILTEVKLALISKKEEKFDWITFVGSGEPTLHASLGWLVHGVKMLTDIPIAVITNGSLLFKDEVRDALTGASIVMPTFDAGSAELYRKINRPHPEATFERHIEGLCTFRREYPGKLWIEVMLVKGLNDSENALRDIITILDWVKPDKIHINLPTRPPVETWVQPPDEEGIKRAATILGEVAQVVRPAEGAFTLNEHENLADAVINIITRHPMRQDELERTLVQLAPEHVNEVLEDLKSSGRAQVVERYGVHFWSAAPSHFPDDVRSQAAAPRRPRRKNNHNPHGR